MYHYKEVAVNGEVMRKRRTLASERTLNGLGLHSGKPVTVRLVPAAADSGIVFVRSDLGGVRIPALPRRFMADSNSPTLTS